MLESDIYQASSSTCSGLSVASTCSSRVFSGPASVWRVPAAHVKEQTWCPGVGTAVTRCCGGQCPCAGLSISRSADLPCGSYPVQGLSWSSWYLLHGGEGHISRPPLALSAWHGAIAGAGLGRVCRMDILYAQHCVELFLLV